MDVSLKDWGVVIPAGGLVPDPLATRLGTPRKALAQILGRTSIEWTLDAVRGAGFTQIAVVSGEDVHEVIGDDHWVPESSGQIENAQAGLTALGSPSKILFLPADSPFLDPAGLREFVSEIEMRRNLDEPKWYAAGLCTRARYEEVFPGWSNPSIRLRDADLMSGAYFATSLDGFQHGADLFRSISESRKSQFKMLLRFGLVPLVRYFFHRVSLGEAESRLSKAFSGQALIVPSADARSIADIDTVEDYERLIGVAEKFLNHP
ncbi:MAG: nucleotidyltransferase family protein [Armatimonadetes bacterium]|nr:nucleotidyltransferase family protein [Armatimonadota bacterium]